MQITKTLIVAACVLFAVGGFAYAANKVPPMHQQIPTVPPVDTASSDNTNDPLSAPVPSTVGGGAPDAGVNSVQCNMLLGIRPAHHASGNLQEVKLHVPAAEVGPGAARSVYFPIIDSPETVLRIGGDMAMVGVCSTPAGQMIHYKVAFKEGGTATVFLPKIADGEDGINLLLVDGKHVFHSAIYNGESEVTFSN